MEAEYTRNTDLYKNEVSSEKSIQAATADYKILKAQVTALEQRLTLTGHDPSSVNERNIARSLTVVSPFRGYIKEVHINTGKYVSPSDILFEVENNDRLLLKLTLFEKDADKVTPGQKVRFFINN